MINSFDIGIHSDLAILRPFCFYANLGVKEYTIPLENVKLD